MKLLYLTPYIYNSGGTERVLSMKVNYLVREVGYDVVIVTTDQKGQENFFEFDKRIKHEDLGLNYIDDFNKNIISKFLSHIRKNHRYKKLLADVIEREKPDICVSMFGKEIEFLSSMKIPCKKMAELHFNQRYRYDLLMGNHHGWIWQLIGRIMTRQLIQVSQGLDQLVVLTKEDMCKWAKTNQNVCQIYNPLPYESNHTARLDSKAMISVGRLSPQKNYSSLIRVWKLVHQSHPDWELNIWGEGNLKEVLQNEIKKNGLENTLHLCGRTNDITQEYLKSSAYIMTSSFEGFPMVLLEAATCGLPLISYDCYCGPKDIIENGKNGLLVHKGDELALAEAICKVIKDETLRHKMGQEAKNISYQFTPDIILPQWPKLFGDLVKE